MKLRKILFWLHLMAGVGAGLVILIMSVTGTLLAFERQIIAFAEREMRTVPAPAPGTPRLDLDTIVAKAGQVVTESTLSGLTLYADPQAATIVNAGREQAVFVDPYTGAVRGHGATTARGFFHVVTDWHRWLGMHGERRDRGRAITGACNAVFIALVMSGFYLWWPRRWTRPALRAITIPSVALRGKARDWNWHNAIGAWSAPVLLFITITGLVISYQWAGNLLYTLTGSEPPPSSRPGGGPVAQRSSGRVETTSGAPSDTPDGQSRHRRAEGKSAVAPSASDRKMPETGSPPQRTSLEALFTSASQQAPHWRLMTLRLPQRGATQVSVMIEEADSWHPYPRSMLTLDAASAGVTKWEPFASYNLGRTLRSWVRPVHTGEAGGFIGQCLAASASAGGAVLVYTGLALAWRRFRQFVRRHRQTGGKTHGQDRQVARS